MKRFANRLLFMMAGIFIAASAQESSFNDELRSLRPGDASSYFELGEDIADVASTPSERQLAIHLFVLADHLDRNRYHRSVLLAIRSLVEDPVIIRLIDTDLRSMSGSAGLTPTERVAESQGEDSMLAVVDFLSAFRRADRAAMEDQLSQKGVSGHLMALQYALPGDAEWMLAKVSNARRGFQFLDEDDIMATLRVQAALLGSERELWSTELHAKHGLPMTVIDPVPLVEIFNIDPEQKIWRNGGWE